MPHSTLLTVHHVYASTDDLLPACGTVPGPDGPEWHTGHSADVLLACAAESLACCSLCLEIARTSS